MNREDQSAYDVSLRNNWLLRRQSLLLIGFILILISNMRGGAGVFAWFMPIPLLLYVALYRGAKERLWLLAVLLAGFIGVLAKTTSEPLMFSVAFAIMSGTVTGLRYFLAFLVWDYIRKWAGARIGVLAFPAVVVSLEYLQAFYSPLGDWGALANTQLYNLPLLQTAALFGFLGISALMAWAAVLAASLILEGSVAGARTPIALFIVVFVALNVYGDLRLDAVPRGKHVLAAAIANDYTFTGALPDPRDPAVARNTNTLIEKTREAARQGAAIAVWGEASTIVAESGEQQLLSALSDVARSDHIVIVAAYVVTRPESGHRLENKFTWIRNDGGIAETYLKHHPVPGEGSVPGAAPLKLVPTAYGDMAGAICYDYDFPQMPLAHARLGADLVVLPSLDWRGMLRRHTLMARLRAIEGGFSLLRPANSATSMGFDNRGQILAAMPNFSDNDRELLADLPVGRTNTLYSRIGNVIAYAAILALLFSLFIAGRNHLGSRGKVAQSPRMSIDHDPLRGSGDLA